MSVFAILFLIILTIWYYADKSLKPTTDEEFETTDEKRKAEYYRGIHPRHQQNKRKKTTNNKN